MFFSNRRNFLLNGLAALSSALPGRWLFARTATPTAGPEARDLVLWFEKPASQWVEALPIGNGSLGAMVFGGGQQGALNEEFLQLNDDTFWSGRPFDRNNLDAPNHLADVRKAVLEHADYHLADTLVKKMQGQFAESYQPLGNLRVMFDHAGEIMQYRRELDLDTASVTTTYAAGAVRYTRTVFVSKPDEAVVMRIAADKRGSINCSISLDGELQTASRAIGPDGLLLTVKAASHIAGAGHPDAEVPVRKSDVVGEGMFGALALRAIHEGGSISVKGDSLVVQGASSLTLLLTSATGFRDVQTIPDTPLDEVVAKAQRRLSAVHGKTYEAIRARQVADHERLFRRVSLNLGAGKTSLPTDARLAAFKDSQEPALAALYFQFGRYLLICSSRMGTQPANLQGIWNEKVQPPWSSNYTTNINTQMNYWPAETCNLSECAAPLFDFMRELSRTGAVAAKETYGLPGWVVHHNVDLWRTANPVGMGVGAPTWANWGMTGPWLCAHLMEHARFTGDLEFLRNTAWPLMRGCAEFCMAWLIEDDKGRLTTCPSVSTENNFTAPDGKTAMTSAGCTMDMALIRELFEGCIEAVHLLDVQDPLVPRMQAALPRLVPYQVGKRGQLQEWSVDFDEATPGQRHMSHLYGLFPGNQITPRNTPELAKAARRSLELRLENGGAYTGWSRAWAIAFWTRLLDGNKAWESISMLLQHSTNQALLDTHPAGKGFIFQIDGNFGATAAMAELLLQSHSGSVDLLPALPGAWPQGKVQGLRARGGLEVALEWSQGRATSCTVIAMRGATVRFRAPAGQTIKSLRAGTRTVALTHNEDGTTSAGLEPGQSYRFTFEMA